MKLLLFSLAMFLFLIPSAMHADMCVYESVEWLVARAEQIYGPHSVTNSPISVSCCFCTADFKLQTALRGHPAPAFSRTRSVEKPEQLGFHAGDTYIFFVVPGEQPEDARGLARPGVDDCFCMWNYLWLERPPGERNGVAIDHQGNALTGRAKILKLVNTSLKLPPVPPGNSRVDFYYNNVTNRTKYGFEVISLPTAETSSAGRDAWALFPLDYAGLVIPHSLAAQPPP
jgi:hypothetical protein